MSKSSNQKSEGQADKAARDNRANQMNPDHPAYWSSRGEGQPPPEEDKPAKK